MLNRTAQLMFRSFVVFGFAVSLAACGYFGQDDAEEVHDEMHEEMHQEMHEGTHGHMHEGTGEASGSMTMEEHAEACPHGGGACCAHEKPHPCCEHTMKANDEAESQPTSQPSE